MTFALAELLVAGGERVGIPGLMNPTASRSVIDKMAQAMLHDDAARPSLPASFVPSALAEIVVLSDFWSPIAGDQDHAGGTVGLGRARHAGADRRSRGGKLSLIRAASNSSSRRAWRVITAGRAERWADDYVARVALHRDQIRAETNRLDWLFSTHTTEPLGGRIAAVPAWRHDGEQGQRTRQRQGGAQRMIAGLPLTFAEPLLLLGLLSLPVLWWLLRVMPPRPRRIEFPPTRLLFDIAPKEETPSRTPWWLTALRLAAAALVILAAAGPIWNPQTGLAGSKAPLLILLDDGWSAASSWDCARQGRRRTDRQCRHRPARHRAGAAVGARPRHHADAGRRRARGVAAARA